VPLGRPAEEASSRGVVLRLALAIAEAHPEVVLRQHMALVGGNAVEAGSLGAVLRNAFPVVVASPKGVLHRWVALIGLSAELGHDFVRKGGR